MSPLLVNLAKNLPNEIAMVPRKGFETPDLTLPVIGSSGPSVYELAKLKASFAIVIAVLEQII
jgi:hypothetical protein